MTNERDEAVLKPCPFCGGEADLYAHSGIARNGWTVECAIDNERGDGFHRTGVWPTEAEAIAAWNTRDTTELHQLRERVARLTGASKALLALCERSGVADDMLATCFPDSKNRSGQTRDLFAKEARRTMNEARAALSGETA